MDERYNFQTYTVRKKVFKIFGGAFHIYDPQGNVAFYSDMKAFKLKEDIRIYSSEDKSEELLTIKARKILDFSSAYDVVDSKTNEKVGVLKRSGMKALFVVDEWIIMDANEQEIGKILEDGWILGVLRRFVPLFNFIPQSYNVTIQNQPVAVFKQNFNPFVFKLHLDFSQDNAKIFDRRLAMAAAVCLVGIEGRQK